MAYSYDDHILDHIVSNSKVPYICYQKQGKNFKILNTNLKEIKEDLNFIDIDGISLDVRVNNGYDFHDFDVSYESIEKVINYYLPQLTNKK